MNPGPRRKVAIVGAGPVGLALAIDCARRGLSVVVIDDHDSAKQGSRAICWSKRSLEIFDRLGVGSRMLDKGVTWKVGRLYRGDEELWSFDLLPEPGHRMPAFVNLQQHYVESYLAERAAEFPGLIELRWRHRVAGVAADAQGAALTIETPHGPHRLDADWVVACDGARSTLRRLLGLDFAGQRFEERFLIADVELDDDVPSERRFWFDPPFHDGRSALLHKQPDRICRVDLQLGPGADPDLERRPENVLPRLERMFGHRRFRLDWVSVYAFECRRLEKFVHGRVIFAGDAAHVVSPFGARGGNGGIQDADNLAWKLASVASGAAPLDLLATYDEERITAADENIANSARATAFMTPKTAMEAVFRDAVLDLARDHDFARRLVNSGRLSQPASLAGLSLQTPPGDDAPAGFPVGAAMADAPLAGSDWLLNRFGSGFALLAVAAEPPPGLPQELPVVRIDEPTALLAARYGKGMFYLVRPDQHVAARFSAPAAATAIVAAWQRAQGRSR